MALELAHSSETKQASSVFKDLLMNTVITSFAGMGRSRPIFEAAEVMVSSKSIMTRCSVAPDNAKVASP